MGLSEKIANLRNLDRRIIFLFLLAPLVVVVLQPLGLPVKVSDLTKTFYDEVGDIPEEGFVLIVHSHGTHEFPELRGGYEAVAKQLFKKNIKFAFVTESVAIPPQVEIAMKPVLNRFPDKQYGVDWANLGFVAGGSDVALAAIANDLHAAYEKDYRGNKISELSVIENIRSADDVSCVIIICSSAIPDATVRQFWAPFGTNVLCISSAGTAPANIAYWPHTIPGFIAGARGIAEYEQLIGSPGPAMILTDAFSIMALIYCFWMYMS